MNGLNFHALSNYIPEPLVALDLNNEVVFVNNKAMRFGHLGQTPLQIGVPFPEVVSANRKQIVEQLLKQVKEDKVAQVTEAEYRDANGKAIYFEVYYTPVLDQDKELQCVSIMFRDITHEKVFQSRVTQLLRDYSSLIENANAMMFSIDTRGYITEWNNQCVKLTQFGKNDALAQRVENFVDESNRQQFAKYLSAVLQREAIETFELYLKTKDTQKVHLLINATLKISGRGEIVGVLFVGQDITELTAYRTSLEEIVKDRTEKLKNALEKERELVDIRNKFVSMASHEFRIPLSNISSAVAHVKTHDALSSESREKLQNIERQVSHMRSLIDDVLTIGKTETTKILAKKKSIDLIPFLKNIIEEVTINAQHSHQVRFEYHPEVIHLESDEKLLRNIFINLISNAIKFSPGQRDVEVKATKYPEKVSITVRDKGIGINEEDQKRVFEPFNRGSNAESIKGTGLGLSIVKRAAEALDGTISFQSSPQTGTTFTIEFKI